MKYSYYSTVSHLCKMKGNNALQFAAGLLLLGKNYMESREKLHDPFFGKILCYNVPHQRKYADKLGYEKRGYRYGNKENQIFE